MENSSTGDSKLFAYLSYRDGVAALDWLQKAFGFETVTVNKDDAGTLAHAEVRRGDAVLMIGTDERDFDVPALKGQSTGSGVYITIESEEDLKKIYADAEKAGAKTVFGPESTEWGTWRFRVLDPEGHEWSFGTYVPGVGW